MAIDASRASRTDEGRRRSRRRRARHDARDACAARAVRHASPSAARASSTTTTIVNVKFGRCSHGREEVELYPSNVGSAREARRERVGRNEDERASARAACGRVSLLVGASATSNVFASHDSSV